MNRVKEFLKTNIQWLSFVGIVVYLNGFWMFFIDEMRVGGWITIGFLIQFFGLAGGYAWISRVRGWRLPKNIKDTH